MEKLEINNFILREGYVSPDGETIWNAKEKSTDGMFYIHVFNNGYISFKFYKENHVQRPHEAIRALCNYLVEEKQVIPKIRFKEANKKLITVSFLSRPLNETTKNTQTKRK